jgi:hypothetical protein
MSQFNEPWEMWVGHGTIGAQVSRNTRSVFDCKRTVAELVMDEYDDSSAEDLAYGARIVACVNALAGVADPAALVASHAEMLAFVTDLFNQADYGESPDIDIIMCRDIIERARRAKGEK